MTFDQILLASVASENPEGRRDGISSRTDRTELESGFEPTKEAPLCFSDLRSQPGTTG